MFQQPHLQKGGAQRSEILEQEKIIRHSQKLLLEQSHATTAAREDARDILEELKIKNREAEDLKKQLTLLHGSRASASKTNDSVMPTELQYPDTLQYPETQFDLAQEANDLSEARADEQAELQDSTKFACTTPSQQEDKSAADYERVVKVVDCLHQLLDIKQDQVDSLEDRMRNIKFVVSCKDHVIKKWERALGTCYAELERIQDSGDVGIRTIRWIQASSLMRQHPMRPPFEP